MKRLFCFLAVLGIGAAVVACSAGQVRKGIDQTERVVQKSLDSKAVVDRYIAALASDELGLDAALESLKQALPEYAALISSWQTSGSTAVMKLAEFSGGRGAAPKDRCDATAEGSLERTAQIVFSATPTNGGAA